MTSATKPYDTMPHVTTFSLRTKKQHKKQVSAMAFCLLLLPRKPLHHAAATAVAVAVAVTVVTVSFSATLS